MSERDIFAAALEQADPAARSAYLDEACGGDAALRARVEALLRAHDRPDSLLDAPAFAPPDPDAAPTRAHRVSGTDPVDGPTRTHGEGAGGEPTDTLSFLSPSRRPDSLGRIGHYEVLEVLGSGAFGIVFRAFDDTLQRVVAVKVLSPGMATTSPARKRFLREARSAAPIQHQNVVRVHAVEEQPLPYLVMEFIAGETLQQRLDRTGPLEVPDVLRIGRQLAEGLAAAHAAGLIHRDIKPANVLIEGGPLQVVKLTDFGLARAADDASISQSGVIAGTPMYMAPEQAKGAALDHRADLFSLGSVLYVLCTGRPPFRASGTLAVLKRVCEENPRPIREVIPETPEWLCHVIEKLHAKDPAERFQTAREVADLLADCEAQVKAHGGMRDFARIPGGKPPRRWRWAAVAALALLLPLVAWGVYALTRPQPEQNPQPEVADQDKTAPPVVTPADAFQVRSVWLDDKSLTVLTVLQRKGESFTATFRLSDKIERVVTGTIKGGKLSWLARDVRVIRGGTGGDNHGTLRSDTAGDKIDFVWRGDNGANGTFTLRKIEIKELPTPRADLQWVQLFNGKDLTGWKPIATQPGDWKVENGELVGRGPEVSHLVSERGDFENFHLRAEVKLNAAGNSGIFIHCSSLLHKGINLPEGIECEINQSLKWPTGSFTTIGGKGATHPAAAPSPPADSWVVLEIQVQRQQITVKVNERPVIIDFPLGAYSGHGYLALQVHAPQTEVRFRKIEIKELPPTPPAKPTWVQLFNGKDLTGWRVKDTEPKVWEVADGVINGRATESQAWLWNNRANYRDFHLRAETRVLADGESGILFRHGSMKGYEAEVRPNSKEVPTGSLWRYSDYKVLATAAAPAPKPGEWFTLEVIARGSRLQVLVNGQTTADVADATSAHGTLALQSIGKSGGVEFRKIEIMELPPVPDRVVVKYSKAGRESSIRLDGHLVTRGELFRRLEEIVARKAELKVHLTGDIDPVADPEQDDFRPLLNAIAGAGVNVKNIEFDPGIREKVEKVAGAQMNAARERIRRTNDLEMIGKSLQSYHDHNQSFPPSRSAPAKQFDKEGKPLLSWRVHLLPYLGEVELYKKFRLDEPWDSEHNKKLLAENPDGFKTTADPEKTTYLAIVGTGTAYEGKAGLTLADFKDGASNTAYVVDVGPEMAVPWTKPEDMPFDTEDPIRAFGTADFGNLFLAVTADGAVKSIPRDVAPESLRALFTRAGGDRFDATAKRKTPLPPTIDPYLRTAAAFAEKLAKSGKMYGAKSASVGEFVGTPPGFREALERGLKAHGLEVVPPTGERPRDQLRVVGSLDDVRAPGNQTSVRIDYEWKGGAGGGKGSFDVVGARPRTPAPPPAVAPDPRAKP